MKLSIFTTVTDPEKRGDNYNDAIECYKDLADEVVVVDGGSPDNNSVEIAYSLNKWPKEFDWPFIGQQFTRGYKACTGDWVIHADLDFIFHEKDFTAIRKACEDNPNAPALSFWKYQFVLPDRYNLKSRVVIAVNKAKYGDRIRFDSGGDFCQPSLDGEELKPDDVPEAGVAVYNYEKLLKTSEQIAEDQGRMERAWFRHFGKYQMKSDGTDERALNRWVEAQYGKLDKPSKRIPLSDHPKYVQETIKNLKPEMWGFSAFGYQRNDYVKGN